MGKVVQRQPQRAVVIARTVAFAALIALAPLGCGDSTPRDTEPQSSSANPLAVVTAPILTGQQAGLTVVVSAAAAAPPAREFRAAVGVDATLRWVHVAIFQLDAGESFAFGPERPRLRLDMADGPLEDMTFGAALARPEAERTSVPALALETFADTTLRRGGVIRALAAFDVAVDLGKATAGELRVGSLAIPLAPGRLDVDGLEDLWEASSREIVVARLAAATAAEPQNK